MLKQDDVSNDRFKDFDYRSQMKIDYIEKNPFLKVVLYFNDKGYSFRAYWLPLQAENKYERTKNSIYETKENKDIQEKQNYVISP